MAIAAPTRQRVDKVRSQLVKKELKEVKQIEELKRSVGNVLETDEALAAITSNIYKIGAKIQQLERKMVGASGPATTGYLAILQASAELLSQEEQKLQEYTVQMAELERHSKRAHKMVKKEAKLLRKEANRIKDQINSIMPALMHYKK